MKLLYTDHNVLALNDEGKTWADLRSLTADGSLRIVVSSWNIVEIEQGSDREQAIARIEFLSSLNPLFIHDMRTLQRFEVLNFLWQHFYKIGSIEFSPVKDKFSSVLMEEYGLAVREDYSLLDYMRSAKVGDLEPIEIGRRQMIEALKTLQNAKKDQLQAQEKLIFQTHFCSLLPRISPNGNQVTPEEWVYMQEFCYEHRKELYLRAPALLAEKALGEKRRQDARRNPDLGDAADLMHCTVGLTYCDYFITRDGFAKACSDHALKVLAANGVPAASLFTSTEALRRHIQMPT